MRLGRCLIVLLLAAAAPVRGAAIKVLAIGDSLTEEYASETYLSGASEELA